METERAFWVGALLLEAACLLWLLGVLRSFFLEGKGSKLGLLRQKLHQLCRSLLGRPLDPRTSAELDRTRCRLTYQVWTVFIGVGISRLMSQQVRVLAGRERTYFELDAGAAFVATAGLLLQLKPRLLSPKWLDVWYVVTSLALNVCFLHSSLDAREAAFVIHGMQMTCSLLAKRTWCSLFCTCLTSAQIAWMTRSQGLRDDVQLREHFMSIAGPGILQTMIPPLFVCGIRRLFHENAVLKMDLQKQSVELGAVTSLLLVCYDAVFPIEEDLTLREDSPQLSGLLLHTAGNGLAGKSLLDFCSKDDQKRISQHFASSLKDGQDGAPVMALHVDMQDSDQNDVKVELLHAQFTTSSNERCFLIGVRELQCEAGPSPLKKDSFPILPVEESVVTFEVPSFEILSLSPSLQELCERTSVEKLGSILDVSSVLSRDSFNESLQDLLNLLMNTPKERGIDNTLWFNLLGLGNVIASVALDSDELLETFVATMRIHGPIDLQRSLKHHGDQLTEANVQLLDSHRGRSFRPVRAEQQQRMERSSWPHSYRGHGMYRTADPVDPIQL